MPQMEQGLATSTDLAVLWLLAVGIGAQVVITPRVRLLRGKDFFITGGQ